MFCAGRWHWLRQGSTLSAVRSNGRKVDTPNANSDRRTRRCGSSIASHEWLVQWRRRGPKSLLRSVVRVMNWDMNIWSTSADSVAKGCCDHLVQRFCAGRFGWQIVPPGSLTPVEIRSFPATSSSSHWHFLKEAVRQWYLIVVLVAPNCLASVNQGRIPHELKFMLKKDNLERRASNQRKEKENNLYNTADFCWKCPRINTNRARASTGAAKVEGTVYKQKR